MSADCAVTAIFPIYGQFGAILKLDSRHIVCKLTFSQIVPFYLTKTENRTKKSNTALTLWLWVEVLFLSKNIDISKNKTALELKGIFSENICVCTYVPNFKFLT